MKNDLFNLKIWWNLNILRDTLRKGEERVVVSIVFFFSDSLQYSHLFPQTNIKSAD